MAKADREEDIESWWMVLLGVGLVLEGIAVGVAGYAISNWLYGGGFEAWRLDNGVDRVGFTAVLTISGLYLFIRGLGIDWKDRERLRRSRRARKLRERRSRSRDA